MRLIDADALMKMLRRQPMFEKSDFDKKMLYVEKSVIDAMPTIEAEPVKHARWEIVKDEYGNEMMLCPVCRSEFYDGENDTVDTLHNYCPNCGSKMDLGE